MPPYRALCYILQIISEASHFERLLIHFIVTFTAANHAALRWK